MGRSHAVGCRSLGHRGTAGQLRNCCWHRVALLGNACRPMERLHEVLIAMTLGWRWCCRCRGCAARHPSDLPPAEPCACSRAGAFRGESPGMRWKQQAMRGAGSLPSPYEWSVGADGQETPLLTQVAIPTNGPPGSSDRSGIGGKAELDRGLGDATERIARAELAQARHSGAASDLWVDWLAAIRAGNWPESNSGFAELSASAVAGRRSRRCRLWIQRCASGRSRSASTVRCRAGIMEAKAEPSPARTFSVQDGAAVLKRTRGTRHGGRWWRERVPPRAKRCGSCRNRGSGPN